MPTEIALVNKGKRGRPKKKKPGPKRGYKKAKAKKGRPRRKYAPKAKPRRRVNKLAVIVNSPQKDIMKFAMDAATVAAGALAARVGAGYATEKVDALKEYDWAEPAIMAGSGVAVGIALKGKYRALGTKLGFGAFAAGLLTLLAPYLAGKLPGFPAGEGPKGPTAGLGAMIQESELEGLGAFLPVAPPVRGIGEADSEYYDNEVYAEEMY